MATKADFSEDEWKTLQRGVTGAGTLVSVSDRDFTDSFGEASALAKHLAEQQKTGATELMREIAHARGTRLRLHGLTTRGRSWNARGASQQHRDARRESARRGRRVSRACVGLRRASQRRRAA